MLNINKSIEGTKACFALSGRLDTTTAPRLEQEIKNKNLDAAFEIAHALKGMYANLSLDPITKPVVEMTELLRTRSDVDYSDLLKEAQSQFAKLKAL